ncbi:MAG: DUF1893 domain-containing protein [Bacillota bacterium]
MTADVDALSDELSSDLQLARTHLEVGSDSVVMVGGGRVLASAGGQGLFPLLTVLREVKGFKGEMAMADSVVGLAAALFALDCPVRAVYGRVISERAESCLRKHRVHVEADTRTSAIMNREGTGMCPMEKIAAESEDAEQAKRRMRDLLHWDQS